MGDIEQGIAQQAYRSGAKLPDRIANAPSLRMGLNLFLNAFYELDGERNNGMGLSPVPWSTIKDYAQFYEMDSEQTEDFFFVIRELDRAYLKYMKSKQG